VLSTVSKTVLLTLRKRHGNFFTKLHFCRLKIRIKVKKTQAFFRVLKIRD
jgi:hypothetical protein